MTAAPQRSRLELQDYGRDKMGMEYEAFLDGKEAVDHGAGIEIASDDLHPVLMPFQRALVKWALRRGRAALFADTGLGKTVMQVEWARQVYERVEGVVALHLGRKFIGAELKKSYWDIAVRNLKAAASQLDLPGVK